MIQQIFGMDLPFITFDARDPQHNLALSAHQKRYIQECVAELNLLSRLQTLTQHEHELNDLKAELERILREANARQADITNLVLGYRKFLLQMESTTHNQRPDFDERLFGALPTLDAKRIEGIGERLRQLSIPYSYIPSKAESSVQELMEKLQKEKDKNPVSRLKSLLEKHAPVDVRAKLQERHRYGVDGIRIGLGRFVHTLLGVL